MTLFEENYLLFMTANYSSTLNCKNGETNYRVEFGQSEVINNSWPDNILII